jgi:hypothetical protein
MLTDHRSIYCLSNLVRSDSLRAHLPNAGELAVVLSCETLWLALAFGGDDQCLEEGYKQQKKGIQVNIIMIILSLWRH